jgi:hypothetical protein
MHKPASTTVGDIPQSQIAATDRGLFPADARSAAARHLHAGTQVLYALRPGQGSAINARNTVKDSPRQRRRRLCVMLRIAAALAHIGLSPHGVVLNCTDTFQDQNDFAQMMNNNGTGLIPGSLSRLSSGVSSVSGVTPSKLQSSRAQLPCQGRVIRLTGNAPRYQRLMPYCPRRRVVRQSATSGHSGGTVENE